MLRNNWGGGVMLPQCEQAVVALHTAPVSCGGAVFCQLHEHAGAIDLDSPCSPRDDGASSEMSSIHGDESPPHKRAKLEQQKKRQGGACQRVASVSFLDRAVLFENKVHLEAERLMASPIEPELSTSNEVACGSQDLAVRKVDESDGVRSMSGVPDEVMQQLAEERKEQEEALNAGVPIYSEKQKKYKWGGCPLHLNGSLQPHLVKSGVCKGELSLRCAQFWKFGTDGKRRCFFECAFPRGLWNSLPQSIRTEYCDLRHSLHRNAADRVSE